jgi:lipid-A-disaccharide synthase
MGFLRVAAVVPRLADLLDRVTAVWHRRRPNAVVLIDYPGYHWWVAARARELDIPVVSFVPPQLWAWAGHRVRKMRASFDQALCSLPFEEEWFRSRGMPATYIGHPYFDELAAQVRDSEFIRECRSQGPVVGLLPGSRQGEIAHNLDWMIASATEIHRRRPDARFVFACFRDDHRNEVLRRLAVTSLPAEAHVHRTGDIIAASDACIAVSGSVGLELLWHGKPTAVIYRTGQVGHFLFSQIRTTPYISIVNLIAGEELYPEYLISSRGHPGPANDVTRWLSEPIARTDIESRIRRLRDQVAQPGACAAAARILIDQYGRGRRQVA